MSTAGTHNKDTDFRGLAGFKTARPSGGCCCPNYFCVLLRWDWRTFRYRPVKNYPYHVEDKPLLSSQNGFFSSQNGSPEVSTPSFTRKQLALLPTEALIASQRLDAETVTIEQENRTQMAAPRYRMVFPNLSEDFEEFLLLTRCQGCSSRSWWLRTSLQRTVGQSWKGIPLTCSWRPHHGSLETQSALMIFRNKWAENLKQGLHAATEESTEGKLLTSW